MAGLFDTLTLGGNALLSQQSAAHLTSHNIANAGTKGYHRQEAQLVAQPPIMGVRAEDPRRVVDALLARRIDTAAGDAASADARAQGLARMESLVGRLDDDGLSASLDRFFGSWRELSAAPHNHSVRSQVLASSEELASRVRYAANELGTVSADADRELVAVVGQANQLISRIAALNGSIHKAEATGTSAHDLRDQRDLAARDLAGLMGTRVLEGADGHVAVQLDGVSVVEDHRARPLALEVDPTTGLHHVVAAGGARIQLDGRITMGTAAGLLQLRDVDVPAQLAALDQFAYDLATAVNGVHVAGVGLDGGTGRALFAPPGAVAGAAAALGLDAAVVGQPDLVAAAQDAASLPGDQRQALAMVALESQALASGGTQTLSSALLSAQSAIGEASQGAAVAVERTAQSLLQLETLRESQSGVSIEEQMLALQRYQRAYQAAAKVISTVDDMLESLMNL